MFFSTDTPLPGAARQSSSMTCSPSANVTKAGTFHSDLTYQCELIID